MPQSMPQNKVASDTVHAALQFDSTIPFYCSILKLDSTARFNRSAASWLDCIRFVAVDKRATALGSSAGGLSSDSDKLQEQTNIDA